MSEFIFCEYFVCVGGNMKDLKEILKEEDLFPKNFSCVEERNYGYLFYDENNKDSYDSNHALIFKERICDISNILEDITEFYNSKQIHPCIYQSINDEKYFIEQYEAFANHGYTVWEENNDFMILCGESTIIPNCDIRIELTNKWKSEFETEIFINADEPWETEVAKKIIELPNYMFFAAYYKGIPVGMSYCHSENNVCRYDYILVSKEYRNIGVARTILHYMTEYCRKNNIGSCFQWPANKTSQTICSEAGFRFIATIKAGRASYQVE